MRRLILFLFATASTGFREDFSDSMDSWWMEGGERAWVENGRLYLKADPPTSGPAKAMATVWRRGEQPGNFELQFDAEVLSSSQKVNNINLFFCYRDPSGQPLEKTSGSRESADYSLYHKLDGYILTFLNDAEGAGGRDAQGGTKARIRIRRDPGFRLLAETFAYHCRAGQTYHIGLVKRGGDIRFSVDGTELLRATDPDPLDGGYFGLRTFRTFLWWDDIRLRLID
jgi:hypothetical protein